MATTTQPLTNSPRRTGRWRTATAVAVAAATIATLHAWDTAASSSADEASFVPTAPCRLFDTRPGSDPAGGKKSPLGPGESNVHTQQVTGTVGNCQVPTDAVAVSMNVTAVNGTAQSNLRVFPADVPTPTASNLNWVARQSPTPNKVDVQLSPEGAIKLYNHNGTVDVLADIVGYYTNTRLTSIDTRLTAVEQATASNANLTDINSRLDALEQAPPSNADIDARLAAVEQATAANATEVDGRLAAVEQATASNADEIDTNGAAINGLDAAQPFAVTNRVESGALMAADASHISVTVDAPVDGQVTVNSTAAARETTPADMVRCSLTTDPTRLDSDYQQAWQSSGVGSPNQISGTRTFDIAGGTSGTYHLVCHHHGVSGNAVLEDLVLTAIFTPAP